MLSVLLPMSVYVMTAAPAPTWLDSPELLATSFVLGAAHPPGHPILVLFVKLFSMIPLGSLAFRAAIASAVAASIASYLTLKLFVVLSRNLDRKAPTWLAPIFGLIAALVLTVTPAMWNQANRVEVYALQLMIVMGGLLALVGFGLDRRGKRDGRLLTAASLAFGLSLANHHFLALLLVPGVIILLTDDALSDWRRTLKLVGFGSLPAISLGLLPYAHLFLRATAPGAVSLGAASDASTFFWVVSARAYQKSVTQPPTTAFTERIVEAALLMGTGVGPLVVVAAVIGLYFLARRRLAVGLMLVAALVATWLARAWLGTDPGNPDIRGYLLVPIALLALGASRVGPLLATSVPSRATVRIGSATIAALALLGGAGWIAFRGWTENDLSSRRESEIVAIEQLESLPPRGVLITEFFSTGFNIWAAQIIEGMRPDVAHFHFPFVGYPGYVHQVHRSHRDLRGLLRAALASGELSERELSALAQRRGVFVEPMLQTYDAIEPFLLPHGLVWEAGAEPLSLTDVQLAVPDHFERWDRLLDRLGDGAHEEQTLRVLLWRIYIDALLFARRGEREGARAAVDRALTLVPSAPELLGLRLALEQGEGRVDITPFLPRGARAEEQEIPQPEEEERPDVLDF